MKAVRSKKFDKLISTGVGRELLKELNIKRRTGKREFIIEVAGKKYKIRKLG